MKNKLVDLNNHLFAELERLGDEDLKGDALIEELKRADAMAKVSQNIINNAELALKVAKFKDDMINTEKGAIPEMLEHKS